MKFHPYFRFLMPLLPAMFLLTGAWVPGPPPAEKFHGAAIAVKPIRHHLWVDAVLSNGGGHTLRIIRGGALGWRIHVFDNAGDRLSVPSTTAAMVSGRLKPGASLKKMFSPSPYCVGRRSYTLYVYFTRWVGAKTGTAVLKSPIVKLMVGSKTVPVWKIVPVVPRFRFLPRPRVIPPFPTHKLPSTGPIATLVEISRAVHVGNLGAVRRLCYRGNATPPPLILANAQEAIATRNYIQVLRKRFGVDPESQMSKTLTTPESFSNFLAELDPSTLKIHGESASVGTLWFNGKQFVPMPNFIFRFRKLGSLWLLDSRATYRATLKPRQYRLNVENSLREAAAFDSLARDVKAGKLATLAEAAVAVRRRLASVGDWFILRSMMKNKRWMTDNAAWVKRVKRVERSEQVAREKSAQTQP